MRRIFPALIAAVAMTIGAAQAQTTTTQTTVYTPPLAAPPTGTLSTTRTEKVIGADGTQTKTNETTYHNSNGVADDTVTRSTTVTPPPVTATWLPFCRSAKSPPLILCSR